MSMPSFSRLYMFCESMYVRACCTCVVSAVVCRSVTRTIHQWRSFHQQVAHCSMCCSVTRISLASCLLLHDCTSIELQCVAVPHLQFPACSVRWVARCSVCCSAQIACFGVVWSVCCSAPPVVSRLHRVTLQHTALSPWVLHRWGDTCRWILVIACHYRSVLPHISYIYTYMYMIHTHMY